MEPSRPASRRRRRRRIKHSCNLAAADARDQLSSPLIHQPIHALELGLADGGFDALHAAGRAADVETYTRQREAIRTAVAPEIAGHQLPDFVADGEQVLVLRQRVQPAFLLSLRLKLIDVSALRATQATPVSMIDIMVAWWKFRFHSLDATGEDSAP